MPHPNRKADLQRHPEHTRERIRQQVERIKNYVYADRKWLDDLQFTGPVTERISYEQAQKLTDFKPAKAGDQYGPFWSTFWFRATAVVPEGWRGSRVDLYWDTQNEATLWVNGNSAQGLNVTQGDRPDAILVDRAKGGETVSFQIEMACNNKFGVSDGGGGRDATRHAISPHHLRSAELVRFNKAAWDLYYDAHVLSALLDDLMKEKGATDMTWTGLLLSELNRFCNVIVEEDETTWPAARKILTDLYQHKNPDLGFELSAIGHAHIDTAWLWPLGETDRKCERTFSTAVAYMRDYPDYKFSCSQAYQYDVIKKRNPDLYGRMKKAVKAGQFIPVGGTWIEPDCNIPSGEALCRQFLVGQRFFQRELGIRCNEFWNPDVFGYNGQLPQIMKQAGIERFLTQKLSWNAFNKPEHHTFMWQGIDGSEVLSHFPPADTYNASVSVAELRKNITNFKDHDRSKHAYTLFGWGDGGGGPTKHMLEILARVEDLRGVPRTQQRTSDEFFTLLEKDITDRPVIVGELYFELHRGTYTSQALVKRNNRKAEVLLHDLEFLATLAAHAKTPYPRAEINALWEILLLNQFHDILPGSSITLVYNDSKAQFEQFFKTGNALTSDVAKALGGTGLGETVVNTIGFDRAEVTTLGGKLAFVTAPSYGFGTVTAAPDPVTITESKDGFVLENNHLKATVARSGKVTSLIEKSTGRESLSGPANTLMIYDDRPSNWEAWDVDVFHTETAAECKPAHSAAVVTRDALRAEVKFEQMVGLKSSATYVIRLDAGSRKLEIIVDVDWQEKQKMLKAAFPVNARSMNATYEMQFGNVERPTHYNTTFDLARYEVPLHKWMDLSEHGFGVSILSESKYGASTFGQTMFLSLLRAPKSPDPVADMHAHHFEYAILPHAGGWREAGVVAEAAAFNSPLRTVPGTHAGQSLASSNDPNLVIDTIKTAEDSDHVVLRLYECHGARGTARIKVGLPFKKAVVVNVMEDEAEALVVSGDTIEVPYTPYQIVGIKLT